MLKYVVVFCSALFTAQLSGQCILINEVLVNGPGSNDGSNAPETEEWIELYNTCGNPVDIGCFVLTDGDFTVTIPQGTVLAPFSYFTIGSINAGFVVDLNWGTCSCSAGNGIGIFTNGNEQITLTDPNGSLQDALQWGSGQLPVGIVSSTVGDCAPLTVYYDGTEAPFTQINDGGSNGCALARSCDGADEWIEQCSPTPDASNGFNDVQIGFTASSLEFCAGTCVDFSDQSTGDIAGWSWAFEGAEITISSDQNPTTVCYLQEGFYDVSLTVATNCGASTFTAFDYIHVVAAPEPIVNVQGPTSFCAGDAVLFTTTETGELQWYYNGDIIPGAQSNEFSATEAGLYFLTVTNGNCNGYSSEIQVNVVDGIDVLISPAGPLEICEGSESILSIMDSYDSYQWFLNGVEINGATNPDYTADQSGVYTASVVAGFCLGTSNEVQITEGNNLSVGILPAGPLALCEGDSALLSASSDFQSFVWYLNGEIIPQASSAILYVTEEGSYTLMAGNGECEGVSPAVEVTISQPVIPVISPNTAQVICQGETVIFSTTLDFDSYQWYLNEIPVVSQTTGFISIGTTGMVSLVATNNGCQAESEVVQLTVNPLPVIDITPSGSQIICQGDELVLSGPTGLNDYQWYLNNQPISNEMENELLITASGNYSLEASLQGCTASSNVVTVTVAQAPLVTINPSGNVQTCDDVFTLQGSSNGNYQWYQNGELLQSQIFPSLSVQEGGSYYFVSNVGSCTTTSDVVNVEFLEGVVVSIDAPEETPCDGDLVVLTATAGFVSYNWSNGATTQSIQVVDDGEYAVIGSNGFCTGEDSQLILFNELPEVYAGRDTIASCTEGVQLIGIGNGSLEWLTAGSLTDLGNGIAFVNPDINTVYVLEVSDGLCTNRDEVLVVANCTGISVPNIFTPNGDGKNDVFEIQARGATTYHLQIFNRWGVLVFESSSPSRMWSGLTDGGEASEGTYYWILDVRDQYGKALLEGQNRQGVLTLLR